MAKRQQKSAATSKILKEQTISKYGDKYVDVDSWQHKDYISKMS